MGKKLKFGVVGCGRVSGNHLAALSSGKIDGELVAVADIDEAKAKAQSEKYGGVPFYADYNEMLRKHPEIQVVDIATPTGYHAKHVIDIARHGRHIIVEKPMALRVSDCDEMIKACEASKARLFVVKQNRFNKAVQAARRAFEAGRFGKMVEGTVRVRWSRNQSYYEQDNWHGTWALDGGVMSQQASHHIDLLQWFMGPVEQMNCLGAARLMKIEVEDTAVAIFKFASGALGTFEATVATRPKDLEGSLSLLGEKGSVIIGGHAVNKIVHWAFEEPLPEDAEIMKEYSQEAPNVYGHGHSLLLQNVIEAIRDNKRALIEPSDGRTNIEILTALYESAACGGKAVKPGCPIEKSRLGRA
ncbi:MAG: oxidoreductase [Lentisphaerae bacterium GWF2_52_8]|nr:MAG: oxidoreductase [Lentisphaerae bacterium GWF2_52_8]